MPSERVVALNQMIIQTRLFYFLKSARYVSNKSNKFCSPVHHNKLYSMPLLYLYTTNLGGGLESITFLSGNTNNGYLSLSRILLEFTVKRIDFYFLKNNVKTLFGVSRIS